MGCAGPAGIGAASTVGTAVLKGSKPGKTTMTNVAMRSHLVDPDIVVLGLLIVAVLVLDEQKEEEEAEEEETVTFGDDLWDREVE